MRRGETSNNAETARAALSSSAVSATPFVKERISAPHRGHVERPRNVARLASVPATHLPKGPSSLSTTTTTSAGRYPKTKRRSTRNGMESHLRRRRRHRVALPASRILLACLRSRFPLTFRGGSERVTIGFVEACFVLFFYCFSSGVMRDMRLRH